MRFGPVLKQVTDQGGNWEQVFGGGLIVHTSPTTAKEIEEADTSQLKSRKSPTPYEGRLAPPRHSGCWVGAPVASLRCRILRPGEVSINLPG